MYETMIQFVLKQQMAWFTWEAPEIQLIPEQQQVQQRNPVKNKDFFVL